MRTVIAEPLDFEGPPGRRPSHGTPLFEVDAEYEFRILRPEQGVWIEQEMIRTVRGVEGPLLRLVSTSRVTIVDDAVTVEETEDSQEEILNTNSLAFVRAIRRGG